MPGMVQEHLHAHFGAFGEGVLAPAPGLEATTAYLSMLAAIVLDGHWVKNAVD